MNCENKLSTLLQIGGGALVLPFLDKKEGTRAIVDSVTSSIIISFDFQVCPRIVWTNYFPLYDDASGYKSTILINGILYLICDMDRYWIYTADFGVSGPYVLVQRGDYSMIKTRDLKKREFGDIDDDILVAYKETTEMFDSMILEIKELYDLIAPDQEWNNEEISLMRNIFPSYIEDVIPLYRAFLGYLECYANIQEDEVSNFVHTITERFYEYSLYEYQQEGDNE
jgi:hypothetical protein